MERVEVAAEGIWSCEGEGRERCGHVVEIVDGSFEAIRSVIWCLR